MRVPVARVYGPIGGVGRLRLRAAKCLLNRFNLFVKLPLNLYSCLADMKEAFVVRPPLPSPSAPSNYHCLSPRLLNCCVCGKVLKQHATETEACPIPARLCTACRIRVIPSFDLFA